MGRLKGKYSEAEKFCLYLFLILGFQLELCLKKSHLTKLKKGLKTTGLMNT